jgi:hypothetical protein
MDVRTRVTAVYAIYKNSAAFRVSPIAPTWKSVLNAETRVSTRFVDWKGCLMFEFAPSSGPKTYDWTQKIVFSLSVDEMGKVLENKFPVELFHDPNMMSEKQGQVTKGLQITALERGFMFSVRQMDKSPEAKNPQSRIAVKVDPHEMMVLRSLMNFSIPRALGVDAVFEASRH